MTSPDTMVLSYRRRPLVIIAKCAGPTRACLLLMPPCACVEVSGFLHTCVLLRLVKVVANYSPGSFLAQPDDPGNASYKPQLCSAGPGDKEEEAALLADACVHSVHGFPIFCSSVVMAKTDVQVMQCDGTRIAHRTVGESAGIDSVLKGDCGQLCRIMPSSLPHR